MFAQALHVGAVQVVGDRLVAEAGQVEHPDAAAQRRPAEVDQPDLGGVRQLEDVGEAVDGLGVALGDDAERRLDVGAVGRALGVEAAHRADRGHDQQAGEHDPAAQPDRGQRLDDHDRGAERAERPDRGGEAQLPHPVVLEDDVGDDGQPERRQQRDQAGAQLRRPDHQHDQARDGDGDDQPADVGDDLPGPREVVEGRRFLPLRDGGVGHQPAELEPAEDDVSAVRHGEPGDGDDDRADAAPEQFPLQEQQDDDRVPAGKDDAVSRPSWRRSAPTAFA
ncbi:hypothetical protein [Amycolatopsis sp. SID8362]|uniref:hypothetical protein n=1 Tax=Amycolatopsis sp. SID8362 TaxID=2690346 RepID=UPI001942B1B5|nr:hypothetical protein [Amycolatopsis sp. SID8362]